MTIKATEHDLVTEVEAATWAEEWPKVDGYYWVRRKGGKARPVLTQMLGRVLATDADSASGEFEFLGPVSPADLEQLAALREPARLAVLYLESDPRLTAHGREIAATLRGVLERIGEKRSS